MAVIGEKLCSSSLIFFVICFVLQLQTKDYMCIQILCVLLRLCYVLQGTPEEDDMQIKDPGHISFPFYSTRVGWLLVIRVFI